MVRPRTPKLCDEALKRYRIYLLGDPQGVDAEGMAAVTPTGGATAVGETPVAATPEAAPLEVETAVVAFSMFLSPAAGETWSASAGDSGRRTT